MRQLLSDLFMSLLTNLVPNLANSNSILVPLVGTMDLSEIDLYFTSLDATASPFGDFSPAETLGKSGLVVNLHRLDLGENWYQVPGVGSAAAPWPPPQETHQKPWFLSIRTSSSDSQLDSGSIFRAAATGMPVCLMIPFSTSESKFLNKDSGQNHCFFSKLYRYCKTFFHIANDNLRSCSMFFPCIGVESTKSHRAATPQAPAPR